MKILYGVQGTGNGHISRACAMADALKEYPDIEVTWLLSGRERSAGFGSIDNFVWREGMTFAVKDGRVQFLKTLQKNNLSKFRQDVNELDLKPYDLIVSDYEPVISHAAKKRGVPVTGIGHQYAFNYNIPKKGANFLTNTVMKRFAPVDLAVGLHWHHFGFPILPPILDIDIPETLPELIPNKVLVYLPFENLLKITQLFKLYSEFDFFIYHPDGVDNDDGNVHVRKISRLGFKQDLLTTKSVISNSGFELMSECLQLGKSMLSKPMQGQMEQLSNAYALEKLGYAEVMPKLDDKKIKQWLYQDNKIVKVDYPDVAKSLAQWIATGCKASTEELATLLWQ